MLWHENQTDVFKFISDDNLILTLLHSWWARNTQQFLSRLLDFPLGVACNNMFSSEIPPPQLSCSKVSTLSFTVLLSLSSGEP